MSKVTLSAATIALFENACEQHKQAGATFVRAYEQALNEIGGENWRKLTQDELVRALQTVGRTTYDLVVKRFGLSAATFERYQAGARRSLLMGVSFSFAANFSLTKCKEMIRRAKDDQGGGTFEAKMSKAAATMQTERTDNAALRQLINKGLGTWLPLPANGAAPKQYAEALLVAIAGHLSRPEVAAKLGGRNKAADKLRQIRSLCGEPLKATA